MNLADIQSQARQAPDPDDKIREILDRLRRVEATPPVNAIQFDVDNEGGSLYTQTNDTLDLDDYPDPLSSGGTWGGSIQDDSGAGLLIGSTEQLTLASRGGLTMEAAGAMAINSSDDISVGLGVSTLGGGPSAGKTFTLKDHAGAAIVTVTG